MEHATPPETAKEIARLRRLISHLHIRAEAAQRAASGLGEPERDLLGSKADTLEETADELLEEVAVLERA